MMAIFWFLEAVLLSLSLVLSSDGNSLQETRHQALLDAAVVSADHGDFAASKTYIQTILKENPNHVHGNQVYGESKCITVKKLLNTCL
jgi:hypothetical protein